MSERAAEQLDTLQAKRQNEEAADTADEFVPARGLTAPLLRLAEASGTNAAGLSPTIRRQLLQLQASHGNHYVQRLAARGRNDGHQGRADPAIGHANASRSGPATAPDATSRDGASKPAPGARARKAARGAAQPTAQHSNVEPNLSRGARPTGTKRRRGGPGIVQRSLVLGPVEANEQHQSEQAATEAAAAEVEAAPPAAGTAPAGAAPPPATGGAPPPAEAAPAASGGDVPVGDGTEESAPRESQPEETPAEAGAGGSTAESQPDIANAAQAEAGESRGGGAAAPNVPTAGLASPGEAQADAKSAVGGQASPPTGGRGEDEASAADEQPALSAEALDPQIAALVADFAAEFGSRQDEVSGTAGQLLDPSLRSAAAKLIPDRRDELMGPQLQRSALPGAGPAGRIQRSVAGIQREKGTGTLPTQKVKVTIPNWPKMPLFKDVNLGSWFLLSGEIESPAWEGEAKPPDHLRDDTKESELQLTADGKVSGYSATFYKETMGKVGGADLEGQVGVEVTNKSVKVSGVSLKFPDWGGEDGTLLAVGQLDFSILEWETGEPPAVMVLSYVKKLGMKSDFMLDGWKMSGNLHVPVKFSMKPNPAKVAEFVTRVIGPRLAAAAPAGLAIGAPLLAGGVCLAIWMNAIQAGEDFATAIDYAKQNTLGYVTEYFYTIMGHEASKYSNGGASAGKAAAQKVLDGLRWDELPAGAQAKIREEYLDAGSLNMPGVQASIWNKYRGEAIAWYRKEHDWDAWAYDKGLPSDLRSLIRTLDIAGPPWSITNY